MIHTVGPRWAGGGRGEQAVLRSCYQRCLEIAEDADLRSIAFPAISTGLFGYPLALATEVAVRTVRQFPTASLRLIRFVCFDDPTVAVYRRALADTTGDQAG